MPIADKQALLKYLPFLRRYARALAGNQQTADAVVSATVQSISLRDLASPQSLRVALYRTYTQIWNGQIGAEMRRSAAEHPYQTKVDSKLAAMPPHVAQCFLLSAIEDFDDTQIAAILNLSAMQVPAMKAAARMAIMKQIVTDVFIIEDEFFVASELEDIMVSLGHRIVGMERTRTAAVRAIRESRPGLILADIQLADGSSGLDSVNDILAEFEVPVVFITAYPERLLTGLRPEPAFVLTKPFKADMVSAIVSQALFFDQTAKRSPMARELTAAT